MFDVLDKTARKLRRRLPAKTIVAALTMGSLTAAKFLLRFQNAGKTTFAGDLSVWERIEQMSDDLAAQN